MLFLLLFAIFAGFVCRCLADEKAYRAPLFDIGGSNKHKDVYIVLLKHRYTLKDHWNTISTDYSSEPEFNDWKYFFAYTAKLNATALDLVRRDRNVVSVETDRVLRVHHSSLPPDHMHSDIAIDSYEHDNTTILDDDDDDDLAQLGVDDVDECNQQSIANTWPSWHMKTQTYPRPPWGLGAISAQGKDEGVTNAKWYYPTVESWDYLQSSGEGVHVYVLDTGINIKNELFGGRATNFQGKPSSEISPYTYYGESWEDSTGHGTAVAGIIGADHVGVARAANLISVKVIEKNKKEPKEGYAVGVSRLGDAFHAVTASHVESCRTYATDDKKFRGSIINLSMRAFDKAYEQHSLAFNRMATMPQSYGIVIVAGAGNDGKSALLEPPSWPCVVPGVFCAGAINRRYQIPNWSNWLLSNDKLGKFYLAPGSLILTAKNSVGRRSTKLEFRGTSLACPYVTGVAATFMGYLGLAGGDYYNDYKLSRYLLSNALLNVVDFQSPGKRPTSEGLLLVNTGIHNPSKQPRTPFKGAPTEPVLHRQECPNIAFFERDWKLD